jgi:hypothetical protein
MCETSPQSRTVERERQPVEEVAPEDRLSFERNHPGEAAISRDTNEREVNGGSAGGPAEPFHQQPIDDGKAQTAHHVGRHQSAVRAGIDERRDEH